MGESSRKNAESNNHPKSSNKGTGVLWSWVEKSHISTQDRKIASWVTSWAVASLNVGSGFLATASMTVASFWLERWKRKGTDVNKWKNTYRKNADVDNGKTGKQTAEDYRHSTLNNYQARTEFSDVFVSIQRKIFYILWESLPSNEKDKKIKYILDETGLKSEDIDVILNLLHKNFKKDAEEKLKNCLIQIFNYENIFNNQADIGLGDNLRRECMISKISSTFGLTADDEKIKQINFNLEKYVEELESYKTDIWAEYGINSTSSVKKAKWFIEHLNNKYKWLDDKYLDDIVDKYAPILFKDFHLKADLNDAEAIIYAKILDIDIETDDDLEIFRKTISTDEPTKYREQYEEMVRKLESIDNYVVEEYVAPTLTERYIAAQKLAEYRWFYGNEEILLKNSSKDSNDSQRIAAWLLQWENSTSLNSYKISGHDVDEQEEASLRYSAFDIAFNNLFNLNNSVVQKLVNQKIDLRSELSNYWIYNYENGSFNPKAREKFVFEKLQNNQLSKDEIGILSRKINQLRNAVDENYEALHGNFYTDQKGFEKIAKIYSLGNIIENIKKIFNEKFENNAENIWKSMWLELDKEKPADIVGDCLFLRWKLNWTDVNIKYDLHSGQLFMNSFLQKSFDTINIGNSQPDTPIWRTESFDSILNWYNPISIIQPTENVENKRDPGYQPNKSEDTPDSNEIAQERLKQLTENKLLQNLQEIWKIAGEKAEIQSQKNSAITKFLRTFNILPNDWKLDALNFKKGSNLFDVLQIIDNTTDITNSTTDTESIRYFNDIFMPTIMKYSGLRWWDYNLLGKQKTKENESEYDFTFDKNNENENVAMLRENSNFFDANPKKFQDQGIREFGADCQLWFADLIKSEKIITWSQPNWKLSFENMRNFIDDLKSNKEKYETKRKQNEKETNSKLEDEKELAELEEQINSI